MLFIIIIILAVSLILYTLLGGADFGAGIIETFSGRKGDKTISKAIAPVWEANHVWLILAIVIIFTGFPVVYSTFSVYLHIPLMVVLMGIVLRGSSFIFRYYDPGDHPIHKYFTALFKISSFITPVFLGITVGAMTRGGIGLNNDGSFYERFILPWFNLFCFTLGLFTASLFAYIAAVFLIGETVNNAERKRYTRLAKIFLLLTFILGILVFVMAELDGLHLFDGFFQSTLSIISFSIAALLTPVIFYLFNHPIIHYLRAAIGLQVTMALLGWFAIHFPILIYEKNGNHLTFLNTRAPDTTLYQLLIALFVGLLLILPSFYFLYKVFKKTKGQEANNQ
jgi:cytochrome bd ubiquinol oxidase subunit II